MSVYDDVVDAGLFFVLVGYPFEQGGDLSVAVNQQHVFFYNGRYLGYFRPLCHFLDGRVRSVERFSLDGCYLDLRIDGREQRCYQVLKSVEYRQNAHQCHRGDGYAAYRYQRDDIDDAVRFFRYQVAFGYFER